MNRKELVEKGIKEFAINPRFRQLINWLCEEFNKSNLKLATDNELKQECKMRGICSR